MSVAWLLVTGSVGQELWQHGSATEWSVDALWEHIYRLFDGPSSTKESLEDVFGELSQMARSIHKDKKRAGPDRLFLHSVLANRLPESSWPRSQLQDGDMMSKSFQKYRRSRLSFLPEKRTTSECGGKMSQLAGTWDAVSSGLGQGCSFFASPKVPKCLTGRLLGSQQTSDLWQRWSCCGRNTKQGFRT